MNIGFSSKKSGLEFYVEVKYRSHPIDGKYEWCNYKQLLRYKSEDEKTKTFLLLGTGGIPSDPNHLSFIHVGEIKYTGLFPNFLDRYDIPYKSDFFINSDIVIEMDGIESSAINVCNIIEYEGMEIEVTTVHSSKGQTHTATLYLETFYEGSYESQRLASQIKGNNFADSRVYHKQSSIMKYVGLS